MANVTLTLPDDVHRKMKQHLEIRWSEVLRQTIKKKLDDLELLDKILLKSNLTEKDVLEISKKIDASVARRLGLAV